MAGGWRILCLHQRMWSIWSGLHNALRADALEGRRWAIGWCCCFLIHSVLTCCQASERLEQALLKDRCVGCCGRRFQSWIQCHLPIYPSTSAAMPPAWIFWILGALVFFYIKSKMWSYCLANSHLRVLFAWICMSLFAFYLQSRFLLGKCLTNTVLSICFI